jgi:hypothetical protein
VSLVELAERDNRPVKPFSIQEWFGDRPELMGEIQEARARGYSWETILSLLQEHYHYPGTHRESLRLLSERRR